MVLFPMIEVEMPPTEYCLRMLPVFKSLLGLQLLLVIGLFVINDFWAALSLALVCLMGYLCTSGDRGINITSCLYYVLIAVMCGTFDTIRAVIYFQRSEYAFMSSKAPSIVHLAQWVILLCPIVEFVSGYLAWTFYKDCRDVLEGNAQEPLLPRQAPRGGSGDYDRYGAPPRSAAAAAAERRQDQNFHAFQGQGQRLGSGG